MAQGEVLFSIESFASYGKLSNKKTEDMLANSRSQANKAAGEKKNPFDFTLWKPHKPVSPSRV